MECTNFNFGGEAKAKSASSYLIVQVYINQTKAPEPFPTLNFEFAPDQHRNQSVNPPIFNEPIYLSLYRVDKSSNYYSSAKKPSAIISPVGTSYVMVTQTEYEYLNKTVSTDYGLSISSYVNNDEKNTLSVVIFLSFSTLRVTVSKI